jgi:oxygen-independent coproporphyrinogen-3 oxidase
VAFGVYIHVPFCRRRCDYCAFATWTDRHHLAAEYAAACRREAETAGLPPATSVYVGGGTPSQLDPELLATILAAVPRVPGTEVTVECNPEDASASLFAAWRAMGVTRVSLGVQSLVPHVLAALGRHHSPGAVARAVGLVRRAGFASFGCDLIYGAVGETLDDWAASVRGVIELGAPHVSCYALTVEPGTPLARDPARHPDDDDQAAKYELADELLSAAGLPWYEISNWARPGHECRHNQLYWAQGDYRGIGCAAHSHVSGRRWWNVRTPERYIARVRAGRSPAAGAEELGPADRRREAALLALRTRVGAPAAAFEPGALAAVGPLVMATGERVVLTRAGRLLANEVARHLR